MEEKQREVNQEELDPELREKKIWKERLREEILQEETERIKSCVDSLVKKKMFEVEKLLEIVGKPAKLVLVPIVPQYEEGEIVSYGELINTGTGTEPSFIVGDPKGSENVANDGSKLGLELELELGLEKYGEDSKKNLDVECHGDGGDEGSGSKLGLGLELELEKDGGCEDSQKNLDLKCHDNGENGENEESKELALEASNEGNSQSQKRKFTISKAHLRPTKKQKTQEWKCTLCDVIATSETNLAAHFKGKKHIAKSSQIIKCKPIISKGEKIKEAGNEIKLEVNGKLHVVVENSDGVWCEICNWSCSNKTEMSLHLCGSEHGSNENGKMVALL